MKTTIGLLVLFAAVLGGGYALYAHNQSVAVEIADYQTPAATSTDAAMAAPATSTTQAAAAGTPAVNGTKPSIGGYTSAQVATHNTSSSCWTSINGNVYDLTSWIKQHPGGQAAILSLCGRDGTAAFEAQHGGQGRPEQELASLKIGVLAP